MKKTLLSGWIMALMLFVAPNLIAQGGQWGFGHGSFHPDSLETVTVSGTAIVDTIGFRAFYYLDENDDTIPDYYLHFGMRLFQPDSVEALRPADGDTITVTGAVFPIEMQELQFLLVFEINGETWWDPFMPNWNQYGWNHDFDWGEDSDCGFHGFGFWHDSLETVEVSGIVSVDTNFAYPLHFLDTNDDDTLDYFLNFGPPWYEPEADIDRPAEGDSVTILGGLLQDDDISMIIVYELNGEVWRDSSAMGNMFAGGWIWSNDPDSVTVHSPFDPGDQMHIAPGWHGGGGHHGPGGMMWDSLFIQISEVFPWNVPSIGDTMPFAGYEIAGFTPGGHNGMLMGSNHCGGNFHFNTRTRFQFHYTEGQLNGSGPGLSKRATPVNEENITVKAWDNETQSWYTVSDAVVDPENNTVTFTSNDVSSNYVLTGSPTTGIVGRDEGIVEQYKLAQNYPNPFNPSTTINYSLDSEAEVTLTVFDVTGRSIRTLTQANQPAGDYSVIWNSRNESGQVVASGIYFYKLQVRMNGQESQTMKKMILMR